MTVLTVPTSIDPKPVPAASEVFSLAVVMGAEVSGPLLAVSYDRQHQRAFVIEGINLCRPLIDQQDQAEQRGGRRTGTSLASAEAGSA